MLISDVVFLLVVGLLILFSTTSVFIWKGLVWLSIISGVSWALMGFFLVLRTQQGEVILEFQEYIQLIAIGISLVMFFSPMWLRAKNMDVEMDAPSDIDIWKANRKEHRAKINEMKNARRDRYGDGNEK
jgi:hypothetical protein